MRSFLIGFVICSVNTHTNTLEPMRHSATAAATRSSVPPPALHRTGLQPTPWPPTPLPPLPPRSSMLYWLSSIFARRHCRQDHHRPTTTTAAAGAAALTAAPPPPSPQLVTGGAVDATTAP